MDGNQAVQQQLVLSLGVLVLEVKWSVKVLVLAKTVKIDMEKGHPLQQLDKGSLMMNKGIHSEESLAGSNVTIK